MVAGICGDSPLLIVDSESGAVITQLEKGDRVLRKSVLDVLAEEDQRMSFSNGQFGKAYATAFDKLARLGLSQSEYRVVLLMLPMIKTSSGLVAYGNYKPITLEWIAEELQISIKTVVRSMATLIHNRILCRTYSGGDTQFFFNPYIYQKGRYINKTLFEMFKKSEWAKG